MFFIAWDICRYHNIKRAVYKFHIERLLYQNFGRVFSDLQSDLRWLFHTESFSLMAHGFQLRRMVGLMLFHLERRTLLAPFPAVVQLM